MDPALLVETVGSVDALERNGGGVDEGDGSALALQARRGGDCVRGLGDLGRLRVDGRGAVVAEQGGHDCAGGGGGFGAAAAGAGADVDALLLLLLVEELLGHGAGVLAVEFELRFEDFDFGF